MSDGTEEEAYDWRAGDMDHDTVLTESAPAHLTYPVGKIMLPDEELAPDWSSEIDQLMRTDPNGDCGCDRDGATVCLGRGSSLEDVFEAGGYILTTEP